MTSWNRDSQRMGLDAKLQTPDEAKHSPMDEDFRKKTPQIHPVIGAHDV